MDRKSQNERLQKIIRSLIDVECGKSLRFVYVYMYELIESQNNRLLCRCGGSFRPTYHRIMNNFLLRMPYMGLLYRLSILTLLISNFLLIGYHYSAYARVQSSREPIISDPELKAKVVFKGLNNGNLYHFKLNQNRTGLLVNGSLSNKVAYNNDFQKVIFGRGFSTITDVKVGPDGYLYILRYADPGVIYRIVSNNTLSSSKSVSNSNTNCNGNAADMSYISDDVITMNNLQSRDELLDNITSYCKLHEILFKFRNFVNMPALFANNGNCPSNGKLSTVPSGTIVYYSWCKEQVNKKTYWILMLKFTDNVGKLATKRVDYKIILYNGTKSAIEKNGTTFNGADIKLIDTDSFPVGSMSGQDIDHGMKIFIKN